MVRQARKRNAATVHEGRVEFRYGGVSSLPYEDESFDEALSVHSIYFWHESESDLKEVLRVLKPGGLVAVTVDPSESMAPLHSAQMLLGGGTGKLSSPSLERQALSKPV
jgi:ubiquinone/menaquinone biosynthesis C-methylase UbiE